MNALPKNQDKKWVVKAEPEQDVVITLVPVEGLANLYATVGYAPEDLSKWMYVVKTHTAKRIIITSKEITAMKGTGKEIIIAAQAESDCAFTVEVSSIESGSIEISSGITEVGRIQGKDTLVHTFTPTAALNSKVATAHVLNFKLHLESGAAQFLVNGAEVSTLPALTDDYFSKQPSSSLKIA